MLPIKDLKDAPEERKKWETKATYWHNILPNFGAKRSSLNDDIQSAVSVEQLELNRKLFLGININNWLSVIISGINLILLAVNLWLFFR